MKNVPKLRFKDDNGRDFPDWERKKLGDICNRIMDGTHFSPKTKEGKNKYLTSKNIRNEGLDLSNVEYIGDVEHQEIYKKCPVKFGDILLTKDGANTGNCCLNTLHEEFSLLSSVAVISSHPDFLSTIFLLQVLKSRKGISSIVGAMAGQAITRITLEKIKNFIFYFPVFSEQTKIADFLTAIDDRISQLSQKCEGLAQYKKGVMQKIFSQELRFKDEQGRAFPAWEEKRLEDFLIQDFREVDKPSGEYLSIGVRSHCKGTFQKPETDPDKNSMEKLFVVHQGDLIVNITFAWEGAIAIVGKEDHGGYVSHRFPTYTFNEKITSADFFRYIFVSRVFRTTLELISPGGAGRNRVLSKKEFLKMKVKLPCKSEQAKIAGFLSAVDEKISQAQAQRDALKQYKQGLLQQMFV